MIVVRKYESTTLYVPSKVTTYSIFENRILSYAYFRKYEGTFVRVLYISYLRRYFRILSKQ
jgi:hypothetical protein